MTNKIIRGHTSPETAFVVDDYPYGFRLRCKIRYWLERKTGFGYRLVSQTTNPKISGEFWNKPNASTYSDGPAFVFLNEQGHVTWTAFGHPYSNAGEDFVNFKNNWAGQLLDAELKTLEIYEKISRKYNPVRWAEYDRNHRKPEPEDPNSLRPALVRHLTQDM